MADRGPRTIPQAVRELCLAFPRPRNSSPTVRLTIGARSAKGKVFAVCALNHHGDGHVALWLNTPALEQSRLLAPPEHSSSRRTSGPRAGSVSS